MARRFLVFQHTPWEDPGSLLLKAARKNNVKLKIIKVWQQVIPDPVSYDALIVLGGSPNVNQEQQYPFLRREKEVIRSSIAEDRPYLGFCLGHQLLADIMGARVAPNFCSSVGFIEGYLTHDGREHPLFEGLPKRLPFFKWHGQAVQEPLPTKFVLLATSTDCQVEAFSIRSRPHIVGVQFDNHAASPENVASWLERDGKWLASLRDRDIIPSKIMADADKFSSKVSQEFELFFENFINMIY